MAPDVEFALVAEGSSDNALVPMIERMLLDAGASTARGFAPEWERLGNRVGHSISRRIALVVSKEPSVNLVVVHRDADKTPFAARAVEIDTAVHSARYTGSVIRAIPIQEVESWVLWFEEGIRQVAGNPDGTMQLGLPRPNAVESKSKAKEKLAAAIAKASGKKGRQLERVKSSMGERRARLFELLETDSEVREIPSWQRLDDEIRALFE